jgi:hypothetical protein
MKKLLLILAIILGLAGQGWGSQSVLFGSCTLPTIDTSTNYVSVAGYKIFSTSAYAEYAQFVCSTPGKLRNLRVHTTAPAGAAKGWAFTVCKNAGVESITCSVSGDTSQDASDLYASTSHEVDVIAGDVIYIRIVVTGTAASGAFASLSMDFFSTNAKQSMLATRTITGGTGKYGCFGRLNNDAATNVLFNNEIIASTGGHLKSMYLVAAAAPGAGTSITYTIYVNGATTALTKTIADAETTGNVVADVDIAAGDRITYYMETASGAPTYPSVKVGICFESTVDGEFIIPTSSGTAVLSTSAARYLAPWGGTNWLESALWAMYASPMTIKGIYAALSIDPGTSPDSYQIDLYKDGVASGLTTTIVADNTTGYDISHTASVLFTNTIGIAITPLNTPSATPTVSVSLLGYIAPLSTDTGNMFQLF